VLAAAVGIPAGTLLGLGRFTGRRVVLTLLNTLMALPTVVVGLVIYGFLSRQGPLGPLGLLFTPVAMIIGQTVLSAPIVANYTVAAVAGADPRIMTTALTLGASRLRAAWQLLLEVRFGVMAAVVAGFGRVIAEVGVAMMLGGNIRGYTRTMTTAIALETSKGEFAFGLALGLVLMTVALVVNLFLNLLQQR
jgi:tungstate transport system permease protein